MTLALLLGTSWSTAASAAGSLPGYEIVRLGQGHYNRLCLAAHIEGQAGLLIVDTGAGVTTLSDDKYGFLRSGPDRKLPPGIPASVSLNGKKSPVSVTHDFHIGDVNLGTIPVALVDHHYLYDPMMIYAQDSARQYDGLIGENLLRHYRAMVDCCHLALYLNTDPAHAINAGSALIHAGWTRVPMSDSNNNFTVPCSISGHRFRLFVDTGAPFIDLDRDLLRRAEVQVADTNMSGGVINTRREQMAIARLKDFQIGDYSAPGELITAHAGLKDVFNGRHGDTADAPLLGLLGGDFLATNNALIDVGNHALYLKRMAAASGGGTH